MNKLAWFSLSALLVTAASGCVIDSTYTYCFDEFDCDAGDACFRINTTVSSGQFCSYDCFDDFDCERNFGFPGACMNVDGAGGICFQECDFDSDCYSSSICEEFLDEDGFLNVVCLPVLL